MDDINRQAAQVLRDCAAELDGSGNLGQTMRTLTNLLRDVESLRILGVIEARRDHWYGDWGRIGSWLGISKQGARQRYARHVEAAEHSRRQEAAAAAREQLNATLDRAQAVADRVAARNK